MQLLIAFLWSVAAVFAPSGVLNILDHSTEQASGRPGKKAHLGMFAHKPGLEFHYTLLSDRVVGRRPCPCSVFRGRKRRLRGI